MSIRSLVELRMSWNLRRCFHIFQSIRNWNTDTRQFSAVGNIGKTLGPTARSRRPQTPTPSPVSAVDRGSNRKGLQGQKQSSGVLSGLGWLQQAFSEAMSAETGITTALKNSLVDHFTQKREDRKAIELFDFMKTQLLSTKGKFTYRAYLSYFQALCDYIGVTGIKSKIPGRSRTPSFELMRNELKVLESMTAVELDSDSPDVFTRESKELIAEAAGVKVKFVERVLLNHDVMKTDRTWYMRRLLFGRPLPNTLEDRQLEAETDRPTTKYFAYGETQHTVEAVWTMKSMSKKLKTRTKRPKSWPWFRKPSSGISRWRRGPYTKKYGTLGRRFRHYKLKQYMLLTRNPVRVASAIYAHN